MNAVGASSGVTSCAGPGLHGFGFFGYTVEVSVFVMVDVVLKWEDSMFSMSYKRQEGMTDGDVIVDLLTFQGTPRAQL